MHLKTQFVNSLICQLAETDEERFKGRIKETVENRVDDAVKDLVKGKLKEAVKDALREAFDDAFEEAIDEAFEEAREATFGEPPVNGEKHHESISAGTENSDTGNTEEDLTAPENGIHLTFHEPTMVETEAAMVAVGASVEDLICNAVAGSTDMTGEVTETQVDEESDSEQPDHKGNTEFMNFLSNGDILHQSGPNGGKKEDDTNLSEAEVEDPDFCEWKNEKFKALGRRKKRKHSSVTTKSWQVLTTRYVCKEVIGEGATAVVYKALDQSIGRVVALKRLHPTKGADTSGLACENEATIISRLSHPNLIMTHDIGQDLDGYFIIMSLVDGIDMARAFGGKALRLENFYSLALQCLDGLAAIHAENMLHLDIKPSNIMVSQVGGHRLHAVIIDFGSAKLMKNSVVQAQPMEQIKLCGTIRYMSPEQFKEEPLDVRTDIYSMGCLFYELLTGQAPFQGENNAEVMSAHFEKHFTPLNKIRPDLPERLVKIIHSMMSKNRDHRPQSVDDIDYAIEELEYELIGPC